MKQLLLLVFAGLLALQAPAQIQFEDPATPWSELLAKATRENKIIFMDAYAEWCGPCKMMARNVFTQPSVGEYYNKTFVNVKMDMEKGEGITLASRYKVRAYPTFLFINGSGDVVHSDLGARGAEAFIELGQKAAGSPGPAALTARYEKGERDPDLLFDLAMLLQATEPAKGQAIAEEFLKGQENWGEQRPLEILSRFNFPPDHPVTRRVFEQRESLNAATQEGWAEQYALEAVLNQINPMEGASMGIEQLEARVAGFFPELPETEMFAMLKINFIAAKGSDKEYVDAVNSYLGRYGDKNADQLNSFAWEFFEKGSTDKALLNATLKWALKSVSINENYYNTDTVAHIYERLGKKGKAVKFANKAIAFAKDTGEDYEGTQQLLDRLQ